MAEALNGIGILIMLGAGSWIGFTLYNATASQVGLAPAVYYSAPALGVVLAGLLIMAAGRVVGHLSRIEGLLEDVVVELRRDR